MIRPAGVALCVLAAACTERVHLAGGDGGGLPGLIALDVAPADATIDVDGVASPPHELAFTATGRFADGTSRDVTADVVWTVDDAAPGGFAAPGVYRTSNAAGGHVLVRASGGGIGATAALTVVVTQVIVDSAYPPPAGGESLFDGAVPVVDAGRSPSLLYPAADTAFPQGLAPVLFQLDRGAGNDVARLAFDSDVLHLAVVTGGDRWLPDAAAWSLLAGSNRGGAATVTIEAASTATPEQVWGAPAERLAFAADAPGGVLSYFSAATDGIVAAPPAGTTAVPAFPPDGSTCGACHAVSRDGARMALGEGAGLLVEVDLTSGEVVIPAAAGIHVDWATFSPDHRRLLIERMGALTLYDADTGKPVGPGGGHVALPAGAMATQPDWSPGGAAVAVALATNHDAMDVHAGRIAVLPYQGDGFGPATTLVPSAGDTDNNYFPRWSPDGHYLAFVHAGGPSHRNPTAELWIVAAAGGTPVPLALASHRIATGDVASAADTMPAWAPTADGGRTWLAFASKRPYGLIAPTADLNQIWVTEVDLARAGAGADPSSPAFWLPSQDVTVDNNDVVWAPAAVATP